MEITKQTKEKLQQVRDSGYRWEVKVWSDLFVI